MTEMFGEAWSPMSVPDLAPNDDDESYTLYYFNVPSYFVGIFLSVSSNNVELDECFKDSFLFLSCLYKLNL